MSGGDMADRGASANASVMALDALAHTEHAHEFVGAEHGDVPFSLILVHTPPGGGPKLHRHPYVEVFVVESGEATFQLGDQQTVVTAGHVVVGPAGVPHAFTNTGQDTLRLTAIHAGSEFQTEWEVGDDPVWTSS